MGEFTKLDKVLLSTVLCVSAISLGFLGGQFIDLTEKLHQSQYPTYEYIPIDYLEYEVRMYFGDVNDYDKKIFSEFPLSPFSSSDETRATYTVAETEDGISSRLIIAMYNDKPYFSTSFWQKNNIGLIPVSDQCLNESICFDEIKPVVYIIKELQPNVKILDDKIILNNDRVIDVTRMDDNTIMVIANSDGIMPDEEWNHHMLAIYVMWIPFEFTQQSDIKVSND